MQLPSFLSKETAGLPNWAWALVVVAGAGVGYLFIRSNQTKPTDTSQAPGDTSTAEQLAGTQLSTDSSGIITGPQGIPGPPGPQGPPGPEGPPATMPPNPPTKPPKRTYIVQKGDTWHKVLQHTGVTAETMWNNNRATLSQASKAHGGKYWDKGKGTPLPPDIKVYAGTTLHY